MACPERHILLGLLFPVIMGGGCLLNPVRPNLVVERIDVEWSQNAHTTRTLLKNAGMAPSGPFLFYVDAVEEQASFNERPQLRMQLDSLPAGGAISVDADLGPLATDANEHLGRVVKITAVADPKNEVRESDEDDNSLTCGLTGCSRPFVAPTQARTETPTPTLTPTPAPLWKQVESGSLIVFALKDDGSLWGWGYNNGAVLSRLGNGSADTYQYEPVRVGDDRDWASISVGVNHTLALKTDGSLYAWGVNGKGQLGTGSPGNESRPVRIGTDTWISVSAGAFYSLGVRSDHTLWAWGSDSSEQLGNGTYGDKPTPFRIGEASDWQSVFASTSQSHNRSYALKVDHTAWQWGEVPEAHDCDYAGDNHQDFINSPRQLGSGSNWLAIAPGGCTNLAVRSDESGGQTLWVWGGNLQGQLGIPGQDFSADPVRLGDRTDWILISGGNGYCMAAASDGTLWTWGSNVAGQLGLGSVGGIVAAPTQVPVGPGIYSLSAGHSPTTAFIPSNRSVICLAGSNGNWELGNGTGGSGPWSPSATPGAITGTSLFLCR